MYSLSIQLSLITILHTLFPHNNLGYHISSCDVSSLLSDALPYLKDFVTLVPNASTMFSIGQVGLSYDAVINKFCNLSGLVNAGLFLKSLSSAVEVASSFHVVMLPSSTHGLMVSFLSGHGLVYMK